MWNHLKSYEWAKSPNSTCLGRSNQIVNIFLWSFRQSNVVTAVLLTFSFGCPELCAKMLGSLT
jgi:hypothetical protein